MHFASWPYLLVSYSGSSEMWSLPGSCSVGSYYGFSATSFSPNYALSLLTQNASCENVLDFVVVYYRRKLHLAHYLWYSLVYLLDLWPHELYLAQCINCFQRSFVFLHLAVSNFHFYSFVYLNYHLHLWCLLITEFLWKTHLELSTLLKILVFH